jgi:hypothetical protein
VPLFFGKISDIRGSVEIPDLGCDAAEIINGTLTRRESGERSSGEENYFDLRAVVGFVSEMLMADPDYHKVFKVFRFSGGQGNGRYYILEPEPGKELKWALHGKSLIVERVTLCLAK